MNLSQDKLAIYYFQITDLWRRLCESHNQLLDITFEEYSLMLDSDIEGLDRIIDEKNIILESIDGLDDLRTEVIESLAKDYGSPLSSISLVIELMETFPTEKESSHLRKFNGLLIDIISKIQSQNKKNQLFLNKAIHQLQSIRQEASGEVAVQTYNKQGKPKTSTVSLER